MQPLILPDLGFAEVLLSAWLVPQGTQVREGERIVEILAGAATVDLPAPADGVLLRREALPNDVLSPGQILGWIG